MSDTVITELTIDARGAQQGSATYVRAMQAAQAAVDRVTDAERKATEVRDRAVASLVGVSTSTGRAAQGWQKLQAIADPTFTSMKKIEEATLRADLAVRRGITTQEEAARVLAMVTAKLDGTAQAAAETARQMEALNRQDLANMAKVEAHIARAAQEAATLTRTFDPLIVAQERYNSAVDQANRLARQSLISEETRRRAIEASRRELEKAGAPTGQFSSPLQRGLDAATTINHSGLSARESAAAFEEDARAMERMAAQAAKLRAELNPLAAAHERLTLELAEYQALADRNLITQGELAVLGHRSTEAFDKTAASLGPVNERVRLTANQVQNLGYQINDATTMLLSGSSPFQVMATQGGQVIQALGDGPGGVRGSLAAIGASVLGLLTPVNLLIAALAAISIGALYFANSRSKVVSLSDAMTAHKDAVGAVADAYGQAASKAAEFQKNASGVAAFNLRQSRAQLELSARTALNDSFKPTLRSDLAGTSVYQQGLGDSGKVITEVAKQYAAFEKPVLDLVAGLEKGAGRADLFVDAVAKIANLQPANAELQTAAKRLIDLASGAAEAQRQLAGFGTAFSRFAQQTKQFNDLAGGLGEFIPKRQTDAQRIEETYQQMMRLAKTEADVTRAQDLRRLSLDGLAEVEAHRRAGYDLDIRSITARSAAERGQIAYERAYGDAIAENMGKTKAAQLGDEARNLVLKQSQHDLTEAMTERVRAGQQQVDQLQQEIDAFGKSAGEVARLRTETQLLTEAREAARQAGEVVDPAEEAAIRQQAAAIGDLTDRLTRLGLGREQEERVRQLQAEAGLIGANADARRIALSGLEAEAELRRQGIPLNEAWGKGYVENARQITAMEVAIDKQQEAFEGLRDVARDFFEALSSGGSVLEALTGAFGRFGQQLASSGFDKLFGGLFGSGGQGAGQLASIGSAAVRSASQSAPVYGSNMGAERTFAAPIGAVERKVLPALSSFSTELTAAAKAIRTIESGSAAGNYSAMGPVTKNGDRAYGAYQVMGNNIADWSRSAIGREVSKMEFLRSVELQDKIFEHRFGGYVQKYGAEGASRAWFAGEGGMRNYRAQDVVGTSVSGYGSKFGNLYSQYTNDSSPGAARNFQRATAAGVKDGLSDYSRSVGIESYGSGKFDAGSPSNPSASAGTGFGQTALGALGAGLGIFSQGYSSGSPFGGLLGGAMGGYEAGTALFPALGAAGPIGAGIGAVVGIVGGILGARKKREEAHKQAAEKWAELQPQYEAFDRSLSREGTGDLRKYVTDGWGQLSQYMSVGGAAWKMGSGNSTAQFNSTGKKLFEGFIQKLEDFREGYDSLIDSLASGQMNGTFAKGQNAAKDLRDQFAKTRDDIDIAFGNIASIDFLNTPEAARQAKETEAERESAQSRFRDAASKYALSLLYSAEKVSDVVQTIDGLRGTASGLQSVLEDLGWTADDAAKAIEDRLNQAIANVARGLEQSVADRIDDLNGKSYFTSVRSFLEEYEGLKRDFAAAGADTSRLPELFRLQAQSIVDGAELTGDAFAELIRLFPQLSGVVSEFSETARQSAKELAQTAYDAARGNLDRAYQAETDRINDLISTYRDQANELGRTISSLQDFADQIAEFRKSLVLDRNLSTLSPEQRLEEARKQFFDLAARAETDDDARSQLTGAGQTYLTELQSFWASSERYNQGFEEVSRVLEKAEGSARSQLTAAQSQLAVLNRQISYQEAQLAVSKAQYDAILGTNEGIKSLQLAFAEMSVAMANLRLAGTTVAGNTGAATPVTDRSLTYLANNPDVAKAIAAGQTFGVTSGSVEDIVKAHWQQWGQNEVGKGTRVGYASGGFTGMGGVNDVAGVVHGQEYVLNAATTRAIGVSTLDIMQATRSLPSPSVPSMPRFSNDNAAIVAAIERLERTSTENAKAIGKVLSSLSEEERRESREVSTETERRRESTGRLAARRAQIAA